MKVRVVKDHFCGDRLAGGAGDAVPGRRGRRIRGKARIRAAGRVGRAGRDAAHRAGGRDCAAADAAGWNNNAPVDGRFTTARQGLWMLMATDGEGRREMTMPGKYVCYQTLENGEGTGADGPAMPLRYQYLQLVLEQEARAALEAQRAARYRQWVADRCAAKEHALLLEALSGMRYSDASAWDMIAQLKQRWNSPRRSRQSRWQWRASGLDSKELSIKVESPAP